MTVYYIDAMNGSNNNDGLSEKLPLQNIDKIKLQPGDTVLFKRGSFIRGGLKNISGEKDKPVTYGAYGEGENPIFCGSVDLSDSECWREADKNIWVCEKIQNDEAGNFVFDNSKSYGTLRWSKEELSEQGDFYDECFGYSEIHNTICDNHKIYLYSVRNPGEYYKSVECVTFGERTLAANGHDMIIKDLQFINSGVHAIAGLSESRNLQIMNCNFKNIGGCVWRAPRKIRFGNGVEMWDIAENVLVEGCTFENIYDSAVTHQGLNDCKPAEDIVIRNNVFIKCGMAAYEQRDKMTINSCFNNNICIDAGEGFSKQGEELPRQSEIWPQPMGHHVFLWRIDEPADGGSLEIKNNIFLNAPIGAAIYSIISSDAEKQIELENNRYYTENNELLNRIYQKNYKDFKEYCLAEKGAEYIDNEELNKIKNKYNG